MHNKADISAIFCANDTTALGVIHALKEKNFRIPEDISVISVDDIETAQYLSPISDVKQQGGELNVKKELYVEHIAADGKKSLRPITDVAQLSVGDKVVSRLTISLDRAMDFIQLKDQRGACFEPVGALSGYRWNNGFGYYVEVEDAATNFFFDHLGKGVYVLEHSYRIARGGTYETGLATIQCAYAPEYASHSTGGTVVIK